MSLIDLKRANNLALALASFKINDRYEQIIAGIVTMDESVITASLLACLQRFFPTEREKAALQQFRGDLSTLGKPERFFCLLFQVPLVQQRIEMFLYKLEFARMKRSLLTRVLVVKRACRDLAENFSFVQALDQFFKKQQQRSLNALEKHRDEFCRNFMAETDGKLKSFRNDLEKAAAVEFTDLQLQLNQLLSGMQSIQTFIEQQRPAGVATETEEPAAALDILQIFMLESRKQLMDIETEFESMEQWTDKLLAVFGETKASCRLADIVECILGLI